MRSDRVQAIANMTTRQKATIGVFILVVLIVIWQVWGLFSTPSAPPTSTAALPGGSPQAQMSPTQFRPQPAQLPVQQEAVSQREMELMKLQQETQAKYLAALNELQVLKVSREIAEANQAIMAAKLATVTAQKSIVDVLTPPAAPIATTATYARGLVVPTAAGTMIQTSPVPPTGQITAPPAPAEISYSVISVSQLQYKWSAVLGYQGSLYHVSIGDILPPDGSKVVSIDRSGVTLSKDGTRKKVSLVPII